MRVMPANNTCWPVHYWAGIYGGLGHLYGPERRTPPMPHLPYALDNGAYGAFKHAREWDQKAFVEHINYYAFHRIRPLWVVVPDVVANADATFHKWQEWANRLRHEYHLTVALAVQDGMTVEQVRRLDPKPDLIFVGGSTEWKWATVEEWCAEFPRVHVGRVNTGRHLAICCEAGAESIDGTGWFRGDTEQIVALGRFLARQARATVQQVETIDRLVSLSRLSKNENRSHPLLEVA